MTKSSFWQTINQYWENINNDSLLELESKARFEFNKTLLKDVLKIHQSEKENALEGIIKDIDTRALTGRINGSYSYKDLYFLDESCDYYFIGDIHSDAFILEHLLDTIGFFEKIENNHPFKVIFLGDYVDRGKNHLKTLNILLLLKKYFPENIYLLMGNHDIGKIDNGEVTLYLKKVEDDMDYFYIYLNHLHKHHKDFDDELLELYLEFMNTLNVAAFVLSEHGVIKAVHGGIPRPENDLYHYISDYAQLTDDTVDYEYYRIRDCILWSDPSIQDKKETIKGKRFKFYEDQLINYLKHLNIDLIIRGHQAVEMGHLPLFDKIHTIFSSGYIMENDNNINVDTAYDFISPKLLYLDNKKGLPLEVLDIKLSN